MKAGLFIPVFILLATACGKDQGAPGVSRALLSERISNQNVLAFEEDASGHIWIGTTRGLNKYDSRRFHQYFNLDDSDGLPDDQINDIFRDSKGRLWVATAGGTCMLTRQGEFNRIPMDGTDTFLRQIFELPDGRIAFGTPTSLSVLNEDTGRIEMAISGLTMSNFAIAPDGAIWCTEFERINRINPTSFEFENSVPSPFNIYHICMMPDSTLWMSGVGHLAAMDTRSMEFKPLPKEIRSNSRLMGADVDYFLRCGDSTLLMNTTTEGIFLYDPSKAWVSHQGDPDFPYDLPRGRVNTLYEDSSLNLWIGIEDKGFDVCSHLSPITYQKRTLEKYFEGKSISCLCKDDQNNFWAGTDTGELYYCDTRLKTVRKITTSDLVDDPKGYLQVDRIMVDSNGAVWLLLSSKWRALRCSFDGRSLCVLQSFELVNPISIAEDTRGNVWIGTLFGNVYRFKDGSLSLSSPSQYNSFSALCILPLEDGSVLLGKLNHQLELQGSPGGKLPGYLRKSALDSCLTRSGFNPTALLCDSEGDIWIGTRKNGLIRFKSAENRMERVEGLSCSDVADIVEDHDGNIWISTLYGLCRYDRANGTISSFFESDGLGGSQFSNNSSCVLEDGTLIFGGTHGISVIPPGDEPQTGKTHIVFENLKVFGKIMKAGARQPIKEALEYKPEITLPRRMNGFSISFSTLDYSRKGHIACTYLMDGFDRYWIDAGRENEANYSNVGPGRYVFRVKATDKTSGDLLVQDSLKVHILPSPWLSWWAVLIYISLTALSVAGALIMRRNYMRVKKEKEQAEKDKLFLSELVRDYQRRERVRRSVNHSNDDEDPADDGLSSSDRAFLNELVSIMEQNITSPELDINKMTATLKMSRAKFFYKVKKLTGETPGSFFRIFKLNRAARLLKEGKYNISEITDRTGFSSISHFSTSFKKRYGISPKDYK